MSVRSMITGFALLAASAACAATGPTPTASTGAIVQTPAAASSAPATPVADSASSMAPKDAAPALTSQDLGGFFDALVPYMLKRNDIAGGVVAVVKDGRVIFAHGYGYADVANRTPVVPDRTLFRVGSTSKLFTWTSVMQLVAAGKIDLDRDVNDYLDFKIPPRFGKPITMRDLMTMTPGFAETLHNLMVATPARLVSLRQYLVEHLPPRIFPPGKVVAYSNYGAALAGYIVQRVSGQPFDDYVRDHILKPLGMNHSTFDQPLPAALRGDLATAYITVGGKTIVPFEPVQAWPAGSLTSSATDMAKFMIAQLQNGQYDGASILPPATVALMHSHQYSAAPGMNGYDLGFYQENSHGLRIIGHGGDTVAFHSDLHLLLDKDVGIFMSFNSAGKAPNGTAEGVRTELFQAFLDRYFPYQPPAQPTLATAKSDAARVAGWYWSSRREDSALRLLFLLGQTHVVAQPDGTITVDMLRQPSGALKHWREVGPLTYRELDGQGKLRFVANSDGSIRWWVGDTIPVMVMQPVHGLQQHGRFVLLTDVAIAVFLATLLVWIGGAIARRRFRRPLRFGSNQSRLRLASRIGVILQLAVVVGWLVLLVKLSNPLTLFHTDFGGYLTVLYVLGVLAIAGGIAIVLEAGWRVARGPGGVLCRAGEALLALCAIYGIWAIVACGLVNFNTHF